MTTKRHVVRDSSLAVQPDLPLIGVVVTENDQEFVRYFINEAEADPALALQINSRARSLAGAWQDLDWEDAVDALDRIRHANEPTSPIDVL